MQKIKTFLLLAIFLIIEGCSSSVIKPSTPIEAKALRLEKQSQLDAQKYNYSVATEQGNEALRLFSLLDDRDGQLRSHLNLTRLYLLQNQSIKASQHLEFAQHLIIETNNQTQLYLAALLAGKLNNNSHDFQSALNVASTPIEKAVVETYLKNYQQAYAYIQYEQPKNTAEIDDLAFVLLQYSRYANHADAAEKALNLFKLNENTLGISDTLYVLGLIAKKQEKPLIAKQYFIRALEVNVAINDSQRIAIIKKQLRVE